MDDINNIPPIFQYYIYLPHLAQGGRSDWRRYSSTAALKIESPVPVPVLVPARRNDNINTYQYGLRDGVVRHGVSIVERSGVENVVRFVLGDSRVRGGIRDALSFDYVFFPICRVMDCRITNCHVECQVMSCRITDCHVNW